MRRLAIAAALAVAGCSASAVDNAAMPGVAPSGASTLTVLNEAAADAALGGIVGVETTAPAGATRPDVLPAPFLGVWAERSADCHDAGQTRITVEPRRATLYGSVAAVDRVTASPDGTAAVDVTVTRGHTSSHHGWSLSLSPDGRVLTRVERGVPDIGYARCAAAP